MGPSAEGCVKKVEDDGKGGVAGIETGRVEGEVGSGLKGSVWVNF